MKEKSTMIAAIFVLLLAGAVVVFASSPPIVALRRGSFFLLRPMMRMADTMSRTMGLRDRISSFSECIPCDEARTGREVAEANLIRAAEENESLKKMLGLKQQFGPLLTSAAVVLYNQEWNREWFIIDAGEEDGVRIGDPVIDEHQFLVGEVAETRAQSATVAVVTNKGVAFSVFLVPAGGEALAKGLGARAFAVELIPRDTAVQPGEDMIARKLEGNKEMPQIFAGRIARVDERADGAFKTGEAVLLARPERMNRVMVVTVR